MAKKIILDCDPGHDDAVAILLALGNPEIEIVGITTVGGNQSLEKVTYNARAMLEAAHAHDIPVYAGSDRPLVREQEVAESIHGETGLDGVELPVPTCPLEDMHAVNFIVKTIMESEPGTITLVPTGPLTNIALALRMEPRIAERVSEVVLMGGGFHEGNWSAVAEFNIIVDPEAAHIVFNAPWKLTMVGLDLTHQALCTPEVQRRIEEIGTPLAVRTCRSTISCSFPTRILVAISLRSCPRRISSSMMATARSIRTSRLMRCVRSRKRIQTRSCSRILNATRKSAS